MLISDVLQLWRWGWTVLWNLTGFCILKNWLCVAKRGKPFCLKKGFPRGSKTGVAFIYRDTSIVIRVERIWLEELGPLLLNWKDLTRVSDRNCARRSNQPWFFLPHILPLKSLSHVSVIKEADLYAFVLLCFGPNIFFVATKYVTQCNPRRKARMIQAR